jgi:hypothetical protein
VAGAALTSAQVTAQVISVAAEGVGGVYGIVNSAQNGNGVGILAGALEAAAAAAAGIGMLPGTQTQTLNTISAALGAASVATNMGSDFANGNLAQGLVDSLNLFLPAVAQAYQDYLNSSASAAQSGTGDTVSAQQIADASGTVGSGPMFIGMASEIRAVGASALGQVVFYYNDDGSQDIKIGGTAAWRDNNPGNMRAGAPSYSPIGSNLVNGFAIFSDEQTGFDAIAANLQTPKYNSLSVAQAIATWAPTKDGNDPVTYAANVRSWTGLDPSTTVSQLTPTQLNSVANAISKQEGWVPGISIHLDSANLRH